MNDFTEMLRERAKKPPRYFVSEYTDGPATRWNVIDRLTQEWVRRFATRAEAQEYADRLSLIHEDGR